MEDFGFGDASSYVFTDKELNDLLGVIESKAAGAETGELLDGLPMEFFRADASQPLALQFQPRSNKDNALELAATTAVKQDPDQLNGHSAVSSALASPADTPVLQQGVPDHPYLSASAADISAILPMPQPPPHLTPQLGAFSLPAGLGAGAGPFMTGLVAHVQSAAAAAAAVHQQQQQQQQQQPQAVGLMHAHSQSAIAAAVMPAFGSLPAAMTRYHSQSLPQPSKVLAPPPPPPMMEGKGQISHSTVEKQRRDRINSLIDELRELVPPQQRSNNGSVAAGEGLEARRPKHVVLADTIQLLKHLQQKLTITSVEGHYAYQQLPNGLQMGPMGIRLVDDDTANSEGKSKSSSHDDMDLAGAPQMPHIPCQVTQNSGVTVERGPDCYYVQVKCRDRKGLLSDIINSLRQLPLEIRTAAVTTNNNTVRDVFEVKTDDASLTPEDVQNLVHDALFQQHIVPAYETGKRPRA